MPYTETALYVDSVAYAAVPAWAATHAYTVGNIIRQLAAPSAGNERCFICVTAGTSLSSEPTWGGSPPKGNRYTESGGPVWQEITALPFANGDSANTPAWHASAGSLIQGEVIKNTAATHYFICTGPGGTGGTTEPTWNTTPGATTSEGGITWQCLGAISSFTARWAAPAKVLANPVWNASSWLVNANMTIYVGDDHVESGNFTYTPAFVCQVLCVDHTVALPPGTNDLKTTASFTTTGTNNYWNGSVNGYVYGCQFNAGSLSTSLAPQGSRVTYEQCLFSLNIATANARFAFGDNTNSGGALECKNCVFNVNVASQSFQIQGVLRLENCSLTGAFGGSANQIFSGSGTFGNFVAEGCDFATNVSSGANLVGSGSGGAPLGYLQFKDCKIPSSLTAIYRGGDAGMGNTVIELTRCDSGAGNNYRNERHSADGTELTSIAVVRSGGASDGTTPVSHQIATTVNVNNRARIFGAVPFVTWNAVTGANRNVTLYGVANDSRVPNNDEMWFDAEYLGSSSSPQGSYGRGSKSNALAAGSALTADTSTWDSAATARANSHAYVLGDVLKVASNSGRIFFCTAAGTSAASEPAGGATTWSTTDKSANITLSGGNLVAGCNSTSNGGIRSALAVPAGKIYLEYGAVNLAGANTGCGLATSAAVLSSMGPTPTNAVIIYGSGSIYINGADSGKTIGAVSVGNVVCIAIDVSNGLLWARLNGGNWNGSASADPATGAGGLSVSALFPANPVFAAFAANNASATVTANFGATSFAQSVPSGFVAFNSAIFGYSGAVDGNAIVDGTATFRAGCRFKQTLTLSSPQPAQVGYLYAYPKFGRPSFTYYLDPKIELT